MDTITIKYKKLVQVELLLHHLLNEGNTLFDNLTAAQKIKKLSRYDIGQWIEIVPTPSSILAMNALGWVFKKSTTGFLIASAAAAAGGGLSKPSNPPSKTLKLDFELVAVNTGFSQFSALPLPGKISNQRAYYLFDNVATSSDGTVSFPDLALRPPAFNIATTYEPGAIVRNAGKRFVARVKNLGINTTDAGRWQEILESQPYANSAQLAAAGTLPVGDRAFGMIRLHCADGLGSFGLFDGENLRSPVFKIRLRKMVA